MRKLKVNIKREVKILVTIVLLGVLIAFSERRQHDIALVDVKVKIENYHENHFLDEEDVIRLIGLTRENLRGATMGSINLRTVENRIKKNKYVDEAELYTDLKGNLMVNVTLRRPIARIVRNDGPDGYIAEDGTIMPVSDRYTARVVLLSGSFVPDILKMDNLNNSATGKNLMDMLNMIRHDEFWHAQVAQLDIDKKTRVFIYPQVGGQTVEFGKPENLEAKFRKLKVFYKEILPQMGWNKYARVNLEYEGQIVAE